MRELRRRLRRREELELRGQKGNAEEAEGEE